MVRVQTISPRPQLNNFSRDTVPLNSLIFVVIKLRGSRKVAETVDLFSSLSTKGLYHKNQLEFLKVQYRKNIDLQIISNILFGLLSSWQFFATR